MEASEAKRGRQLVRRLADTLERLVSDPEALARFERATLEDPTLALGPTLPEYFGWDAEESSRSDPWNAEE